MSGNIINLTDQNFIAEMNKAKLPVLVDFWAAWCGPCKMLAPVIDEMAGEYADRLLVGKLNVDENRQTASDFGVMSIPTLILFRNAKEVKRITGFRPKEELTGIVNQALG